MKNINISPTLKLPHQIAQAACVVLGQRGKGKSYLIDVMIEEVVRTSGQQVVIVDPTGAHSGLKSSADGKSEGLAFVIFGGEHADIEIKEGSGALIARAIVEKGFNAILDLDGMRKGKRILFLIDFLEELYRINKASLLLVIDEAHTICPQRVSAGPIMELIGAAEDIVTLGRRKGFGVVLATQRPQMLNKNLIAQCEVMVTLGLAYIGDIKAVDEWAAANADPAQLKIMRESLPALPRGEAWFWSPAFDIFERAKVRQRDTFDSGATPKPGERKKVPKVMSKTDVAAIGEELSKLAEEQRNSNPTALKNRVRELEKQLASAMEVAKTVVATPNKTLLLAERNKGIEIGFEQCKKRVMESDAKLLGIARKMKDASVSTIWPLIEEFEEHMRAVNGKTPGKMPTSGMRAKPEIDEAKAEETRAKYQAPVSTESNRPGNAASKLGRSEQKVLIVLAQVHPKSLNRSSLGARVGIKPTGSSMTTYLSHLRTGGFIEGSSDSLRITDSGLAEIGTQYEPIPGPGEPLFNYWLEKVGSSNAMGKVMLALKGHDEGLTRDEIGSALGINPKGSSLTTYLSRLSTLGVIERDGYAIKLMPEIAV